MNSCSASEKPIWFDLHSFKKSFKKKLNSHTKNSPHFQISSKELEYFLFLEKRSGWSLPNKDKEQTDRQTDWQKADCFVVAFYHEIEHPMSDLSFIIHSRKMSQVKLFWSQQEI